MLFTHEVAVERGRADVGEHAARRVDRVAARGLHCNRPATVDDDAGDRRRTADLTAARDETTHECCRELSRAALGNGEAMLLTDGR